MTNEDKKLIADYMDWDGTTTIEGYAIPTPEIHYFDLNAAGACVNEMQRRRNWVAFHRFTVDKYSKDCFLQAGFIAWLYDADNFFTAMATWLKEEKK